ncbi:hypothetical protein BLNAU_6360 [Blattamonas nauphoetae]|uniref:Uncharacterized protein n=1 Tax=Blattamonas nauphoetae TaxID=2049346 RepID=A0ABQ9Y4E5_9EUKA|nr:hypothetical protein BLNAU_6360 [Blattamonas nauphoetae]
MQRLDGDAITIEEIDKQLEFLENEMLLIQECQSELVKYRYERAMVERDNSLTQAAVVYQSNLRNLTKLIGAERDKVLQVHQIHYETLVNTVQDQLDEMESQNSPEDDPKGEDKELEHIFPHYFLNVCGHIFDIGDQDALNEEILGDMNGLIEFVGPVANVIASLESERKELVQKEEKLKDWKDDYPDQNIIDDEIRKTKRQSSTRNCPMPPLSESDPPLSIFSSLISSIKEDVNSPTLSSREQVESPDPPLIQKYPLSSIYPNFMGLYERTNVPFVSEVVYGQSGAEQLRPAGMQIPDQNLTFPASTMRKRPPAPAVAAKFGMGESQMKDDADYLVSKTKSGLRGLSDGRTLRRSKKVEETSFTTPATSPTNSQQPPSPLSSQQSPHPVNLWKEGLTFNQLKLSNTLPSPSTTLLDTGQREDKAAVEQMAVVDPIRPPPKRRTNEWKWVRMSMSQLKPDDIHLTDDGTFIYQSQVFWEGDYLIFDPPSGSAKLTGVLDKISDEGITIRTPDLQAHFFSIDKLANKHPMIRLAY